MRFMTLWRYRFSLVCIIVTSVQFLVRGAHAGIVVQDTFTEASDTVLTSHTPDTNKGWTDVFDEMSIEATYETSGRVFDMHVFLSIKKDRYETIRQCQYVHRSSAFCSLGNALRVTDDHVHSHQALGKVVWVGCSRQLFYLYSRRAQLMRRTHLCASGLRSEMVQMLFRNIFIKAQQNVLI